MPNVLVTAIDGDGKPISQWETTKDGEHRTLPRREPKVTPDLEALIIALEVALSLPKDHPLLTTYHDRWLAQRNKLSHEASGFISEPVSIKTVEAILDGLKNL